MSSRKIEQHFRVTFCRGQISRPKRDEAATVGQGVTQRRPVTERLRSADGALHSPPRLVGEPPQPEDPRQHDAPCDILIEPEPDEPGPPLLIDLGPHYPRGLSPRIR